MALNEEEGGVGFFLLRESPRRVETIRKFLKIEIIFIEGAAEFLIEFSPSATYQKTFYSLYLALDDDTFTTSCRCFFCLDGYKMIRIFHFFVVI